MLVMLPTTGNGNGSLIMFPEKQMAVSKAPLSPSLAGIPSPSPNTQELLRQQELQLRVLQEQVSVAAYLSVSEAGYVHVGNF